VAEVTKGFRWLLAPCLVRVGSLREALPCPCAAGERPSVPADRSACHLADGDQVQISAITPLSGVRRRRGGSRHRGVEGPPDAD
jgi:hypothetical protein